MYVLLYIYAQGIEEYFDIGYDRLSHIWIKTWEIKKGAMLVQIKFPGDEREDLNKSSV